MSDLEHIKESHKLKEIKDIRQDIDKLDALIRNNAWDEVDKYLGDLSWKYLNDRIENGYMSIVPPSSVQQGAANCRQFLVFLIGRKAAEETQKQLGGNENVH